MASNYISPISMDALSNLCQELGKNNYINAHDFERYQVKRGLRNSDGTGVMAGLTRICSVEGYYILDGERIPTDGKLSYRGYDIRDLVDNCIAEDRFGYEEVVWLLLFGNLPTANQLYSLHEVLSECRALPDEFVEDVIMKHASKDIMNKMARCILSLYSFDENPDDTSIPNVLRQSLQLIAQTPTIMNSAYQIKRRTFYNKTMFDKYGLEAPKTWTELAECSKIIHEKEGIPGFGTDSLVDTYQCLIMQAGSGYIDEDGNYAIDETIAKEKLNWFADLVKSGDFRLVGEDVFFSGPFGSQAVASYIGSSAGVSYVELAVNDTFEIGCVPIPQEGPVRYISSWGNNFACLSTDEDHARGAYMFLKFLTSTENIVQWAEAFGTVPIYKEARESAEFQQFAETNIAVKALTEEADDIGMLASVPGAAAMRTEIDKMVQSVALNVSDADTAYAAFEAACREALAK